MAPQPLLKSGVFIQKGYLDAGSCNKLLEQITSYRNTHQVPTIERKFKERSLKYQVIDGIAIKNHLPDFTVLYDKINNLVNSAYGSELYPLENQQVGLNINITPVGGEYRWHYDRNRLTAILYLNEVEGGETEIYPNYRIKAKNSRWQQWWDNFLMKKWIRNAFSKMQVIKPETGMLVLMLGNRSLHSVREVLGDKDRVNIIASFDEKDQSFSVSPKLDHYLYLQAARFESDPNYLDA